MTPQVLFAAAVVVALVVALAAYRARRPELRYALYSVAGLVLTLGIPGGRVLVLPAIFTVMLVLTYWAAKPRT
jgi:hypothetical protein